MSQNTIVKASALKNPEGMAKDRLAALIQHMSRLAEVDAKVAEQAIRYIVDDEGEEVLLTLGGLVDAAKAMALEHNQTIKNWNLFQKIQKERWELLHPTKESTPGVWVRFGKVCDAVWRAGNQTAAKIAAGSEPGWLLRLIGDLTTQYYGNIDEKRRWPVPEMEKVLLKGELGTDILARVILDQSTFQAVPGFNYYNYHNLPNFFTGWPEYLARHLNVVRAIVTQGGAELRASALRTLSNVKFDFTPIIDVLVELGTASAKTPREQAWSLLTPFAAAARPFVEKTLAEGDAGQRHEAAVLLWRLLGDKATDLLRKHAEQESSERIRQTIEKLLAAPTDVPDEQFEALEAKLTPVQIETGVVPLPAEARAEIHKLFEQAYANAKKQYDQQMEKWNAPDRPKYAYKPNVPPEVPRKEIDAILDFVEGKADQVSGQKFRQYAYNMNFGDWFAPPGVHLIHVARLAVAFQHMQLHQLVMWWANQAVLEGYRGRCKTPFGLRELDAAVGTLPGCKPGIIARTWLTHNGGYQNFCDWEPEAVWPIFAENPDTLREVLTAMSNRGADYSQRDWALPTKRRNAFRVLAMFPQLPAGFIPMLWELALGESKAERPLAQAALATVADKTPKILVALKDGKQTIRAAAAEWLGKVGDKSAIETLKEAFINEKQELVKGTIMSALEALGADVNEFLDRKELLKEAEAGLKKKRPRGMEWVPLDSLPKLHWQDTAKQVDPRIVQWWVVQSIQQKSPVAGPLLRRYIAMCNPDEAAALARFALQSWIGKDTSTLSQEEAAARAKQETDKLWNIYGQHQYYLDMYKNDKQNLYQQMFQKFSTDCIGSANDQKGMLTLVSAAGDGDSAKQCEQYIRKWFGNRLAQCKALVEVLAWIKHPLAIQVLLGLANRFRTKAIRQAAEEHVQALADRENWTIDELADRTIPDGGFERPTDDEGKPVGAEAALLLDYGPRQFTVKLGDDLQPVIMSSEGKSLKSPPAPGKSDDEEKAKAAKKAFTDAKKVVKEVVKRQTERFYEALCTQRAWRFEDWRRYLAGHPVVGKLCVRTAWTASTPATDGAAEKLLGCFRLLEDGSLTNEKDEEVKFEPDAQIRLAHTCNTPKEVADAWIKHLEDYDVTPLFQQFGRATYVLPDDKKKDTEIRDFEGHALTTFKLRGKANKLGYERGDAQDGGCFYQYKKPFASLTLQAVLEFTGSTLPEEDIPAALVTLYFTRLKGDKDMDSYWNPAKTELSKIPAVLLSECYNDVKQIAAEGSGFDPKWKERGFGYY